MFKKVFYLLIDDDSFPFYEISVKEDTLVAENPAHQQSLIAFSSDPVVVDLNNIGKMPKVGLSWSGLASNIPDDLPSIEQEEGVKYYCFIVNGIVSQNIKYTVSTDKDIMITAALSSSPSIDARLETK